MTAATGEDRGLDPAATERRAIPADTIANRLMLARAMAGHISIRRAAELCGLGRGAWTGWERGAKTGDILDAAQIISEKLGVDLQWLLYGGPLTRVPPTQRDRSGRRGGGSLTAGYAMIPDRIRPFGPVRMATRRDVAGGPRDTRPTGRREPSNRVKSGRRAA